MYVGPERDNKKNRRNTKIGRKVVPATGDVSHQFQDQRSRSSGSLTKNQPFFRNGEAFELGNGWSIMTCIDTRDDLQAETVGGSSSHHLQGAGAYCSPHSLSPTSKRLCFHITKQIWTAESGRDKYNCVCVCVCTAACLRAARCQNPALTIRRLNELQVRIRTGRRETARRQTSRRAIHFRAQARSTRFSHQPVLRCHLKTPAAAAAAVATRRRRRRRRKTSTTEKRIRKLGKSETTRL